MTLKDGKSVEDDVLTQNTPSKTTINQPYIPAGGWQKGTYTFQLTVVAVASSSRAENVLITVDIPDKIVVP